jgi:signal transduction histidine kinase
MRFRAKLQLLILPFIIIPVLLAGHIYSSIGRERLWELKDEVLQLRLDSLYRYALQEYSTLEELGLTNTVFFIEKAWKSVERFADQLRVLGDPLFILNEEQRHLLFSPESQDDLLRDEMGLLKTTSSFFPNKENVYLLYYRRFVKWNMILISATEEKSIYKPIDDVTNLFLLFSLGNLLFFIIVAFFLSKRITAPLIKLTSLAKEMANNNLSVRADIKSRDEIGMLAENFNTMVRQLEASTKNLEQLVEAEKMAALGSLVAGISHEINTPIGIGITAVSHLEGLARSTHEQNVKGLLETEKLNRMLEKTVEMSELALRNLQRAGKLVANFKQVAVDQHIEEKCKMNLSEHLYSALLTLKPKLKRSKVTVSIDGPSGLVMVSYPGAIWQVVTNLVLNGILHAFEPDEEGSIKIIFRKVGEQVELSISDNGKGIEEAEVSKIFNPFYTTRRHKGGTGLGLHIVYNIVTQLLKGNIVCSSTLGEGTTFIITLPFEDKIIPSYKQ